MPRIIKIESARHMDGDSWEVGQEIEYNSGKIITEIKDCSMEFPDSIDYQYDIFVNNKPWKSLINMPVKVEYSLED
jgi:hypothetical protein